MAKRDPWVPLRKSYPFSMKINRCSVGAETLYLRLLTQTDDFGNYWGSPQQLLGQLFTLRWERGDVRARDVTRWRNELVEVGLLSVYEFDGCEYIHMVDVKKLSRSDRTTDLRFPREPDTARGPAANGPEAGSENENKTDNETETESNSQPSPALDCQSPSTPPAGASTAVAHLNALIGQFNRAAGTDEPAPTLIPECSPAQAARHLIERGITAERIARLTTDDLARARRRWRKRVGTHNPDTGQREPTWGIWYLADTVIEADNAAHDNRRAAEATRPKADPAAQAKAAADAAQRAEMVAAWDALPAADRAAIAADHNRRFRIATDATAQAEWWQGRAAGTTEPTS